MGGCLLVMLIALLLPRQRQDGNEHDAFTNAPPNSGVTNSFATDRARRFTRAPSFADGPAQTAEEIVAGKVKQFGRSRLEIVRSIGRRLNKDVPPEIKKFFDALDAWNWEELDSLWRVLATHSGQYDYSTNHWEEINPFWPAVLDAYGVAEQAHDWPAQKLLDYGNAILDSLRPGMVYVGGTDPGRWIPELLNETSGGEPHIIVTQNAFADSRYLEFMNTLYGDRFATLTQDESKRAFDEYTADARKRLEHDQQFPDEPKQLRPGEDVRMSDGKVQVSGQVAVMAINEKLLQAMMQKNPAATFAMEESFPFPSTFANAAPLGPIMELGVRDEQSALTQERAAQSVDYWRDLTRQLLADPDARDSAEVLKSYSKLVSSQGGLFASHNFTAEAEQAFRLAVEICPYSPEAVFRLVNLLVEQHRIDDALPVVENAMKADPHYEPLRSLAEELKRKKGN